jgi:hypothetical protein
MTGTTSPIHTAKVSKRLAPGQNGTKRCFNQYGNALVCVRYRQDQTRRYTTVEIVVDQRALLPRATRLEDFVHVPIGYRETELRTQAKAAGARWDPEQRSWLMTKETAKRLGLSGRINKDAQQ